MARGDLFDFGDPTDAQRRGLDGQFIGGPKPGGLLDVPERGKPQGVEAWGAGVDAPRRRDLQGVERYGRPLGAPRVAERTDLQSPWVALLVVAALVAGVVFLIANGRLGGRDGDAPSGGTPAVSTTRVLPGQGGRYVMPGSGG